LLIKIGIKYLHHLFFKEPEPAFGDRHTTPAVSFPDYGPPVNAEESAEFGRSHGFAVFLLKHV